MDTPGNQGGRKADELDHVQGHSPELPCPHLQGSHPALLGTTDITQDIVSNHDGLPGREMRSEGVSGEFIPEPFHLVGHNQLLDLMFKTPTIQIKQDNIVIILIKSQPTLNLSPAAHPPPKSRAALNSAYVGNLKSILRCQSDSGVTRTRGEADADSPLLKHRVEFTCS